ncbi:uncharacterized protein LOC135401610 isoform X2 [Ornithodoros turicata]|uniref:uncharacterized protein LOC135401610 isoform X2 n=1 Tax=Ornithodoros turicata TaxID=34597 RepID=UPI003139601F
MVGRRGRRPARGRGRGHAVKKAGPKKGAKKARSMVALGDSDVQDTNVTVAANKDDVDKEGFSAEVPAPKKQVKKEVKPTKGVIKPSVAKKGKKDSEKNAPKKTPSKPSRGAKKPPPDSKATAKAEKKRPSEKRRSADDSGNSLRFGSESEAWPSTGSVQSVLSMLRLSQISPSGGEERRGSKKGETKASVAGGKKSAQKAAPKSAEKKKVPEPQVKKELGKKEDKGEGQVSVTESLQTDETVRATDSTQTPEAPETSKRGEQDLKAVEKMAVKKFLKGLWRTYSATGMRDGESSVADTSASPESSKEKTQEEKRVDKKDADTSKGSPPGKDVPEEKSDDHPKKTEKPTEIPPLEKKASETEERQGTETQREVEPVDQPYRRPKTDDYASPHLSATQQQFPTLARAREMEEATWMRPVTTQRRLSPGMSLDEDVVDEVTEECYEPKAEGGLRKTLKKRRISRRLSQATPADRPTGRRTLPRRDDDYIDDAYFETPVFREDYRDDDYTPRSQLRVRGDRRIYEEPRRVGEGRERGFYTDNTYIPAQRWVKGIESSSLRREPLQEWIPVKAGESSVRPVKREMRPTRDDDGGGPAVEYRTIVNLRDRSPLPSLTSITDTVEYVYDDEEPVIRTASDECFLSHAEAAPPTYNRVTQPRQPASTWHASRGNIWANVKPWFEIQEPKRDPREIVPQSSATAKAQTNGRRYSASNKDQLSSSGKLVQDEAERRSLSNTSPVRRLVNKIRRMHRDRRSTLLSPPPPPVLPVRAAHCGCFGSAQPMTSYELSGVGQEGFYAVAGFHATGYNQELLQDLEIEELLHEIEKEDLLQELEKRQLNREAQRTPSPRLERRLSVVQTECRPPRKRAPPQPLKVGQQCSDAGLKEPPSKPARADTFYRRKPARAIAAPRLSRSGYDLRTGLDGALRKYQPKRKMSEQSLARKDTDATVRRPPIDGRRRSSAIPITQSSRFTWRTPAPSRPQPPPCLATSGPQRNGDWTVRRPRSQFTYQITPKQQYTLEEPTEAEIRETTSTSEAKKRHSMTVPCEVFSLDTPAETESQIYSGAESGELKTTFSADEKSNVTFPQSGLSGDSAEEIAQVKEATGESSGAPQGDTHMRAEVSMVQHSVEQATTSAKAESSLTKDLTQQELPLKSDDTPFEPSEQEIPKQTTTLPSRQEIPKQTTTLPSRQEIPQETTTLPSKQEIPKQTTTLPSKQEIPKQTTTLPSKQEIPKQTTTLPSKQEIPKQTTTLPSKQEIPKQSIPSMYRHSITMETQPLINEAYDDESPMEPASKASQRKSGDSSKSFRTFSVETPSRYIQAARRTTFPVSEDTRFQNFSVGTERHQCLQRAPRMSSLPQLPIEGAARFRTFAVGTPTRECIPVATGATSSQQALEDSQDTLRAINVSAPVCEGPPGEEVTQSHEATAEPDVDIGAKPVSADDEAADKSAASHEDIDEGQGEDEVVAVVESMSVNKEGEVAEEHLPPVSVPLQYDLIAVPQTVEQPEMTLWDYTTSVTFYPECKIVSVIGILCVLWIMIVMTLTSTQHHGGRFATTGWTPHEITGAQGSTDERNSTSEMPSTQPVTSSPAIHYCSTDYCKREGVYLDAILSDATDPCDDFYSYVCRTWMEDAEAPTDDVIWEVSRDSMLQYNMERDVVHYFDDPHLVDDVSPAGDLYRSCMLSASTSGVDYLRLLFKQWHIGGWPVPQTVNKQIEQVFTFAGELLRDIGLDVFVKVDVVTDPTSSKRRVVALDEPRVLLIAADMSMPKLVELVKLATEEAAAVFGVSDITALATEVVSVFSSFSTIAGPSGAKSGTPELLKMPKEDFSRTGWTSRVLTGTTRKPRRHRARVE